MKTCDRLNGKNYRSWKVQMMLHLKDAKLWDVVKVTEVTNGTQDEIEKWRIRSEEAGVKIMLCINAELLDLVEGEEHGFKVWMKLKEYYEATNMPNQRFYQQKLYSLRYDSFPGMEKYLLAALQIKNDLAADACLYSRTNTKGLVLLAVYVDDIVIAASTKELELEAKTPTTKKFDMTNLGELQWFLGMKVTRDSKTGAIYLDQTLKYVISHFRLCRLLRHLRWN
jgi:hypothetical protein